MIDWSELITITISLVSGGVINQVGNIAYRKYHKKSEKLKPQGELMDIADKSVNVADSLQTKIGDLYERVNALNEENVKLHRQVAELTAEVESLRKSLDVTKCTDFTCTKRQPPYKGK